jgi:hypothetical protein
MNMLSALVAKDSTLGQQLLCMTRALDCTGVPQTASAALAIQLFPRMKSMLTYVWVWHGYTCTKQRSFGRSTDAQIVVCVLESSQQWGPVWGGLLPVRFNALTCCSPAVTAVTAV